MLPEVVRLAELEDTLGGDADLLVPDLESLLIGGRSLAAAEYGRIQPVRFQPQPLGAGQELPAPADGFPLEVIPKGEVAQHFEVGAVAGGLADILDVAGTDALLAGADPMAGRLHLAGEVGLHGRHAGVDEQKAGVILRNQGKAGEPQMLLALEEFQEHFADFVQTIGFVHSFFLLLQ